MTTHFAKASGAAGTGDGSSEANAATLVNCITDNVILAVALAAGDIIYCKGDATISYDSAVYAATAVAGTSVAPISVIGYSSTIGDDGLVTLSNTTARAHDCISVAHSYWHFYNFVFSECKDGIDFTTGNIGVFCKNILGTSCTTTIKVGSGTGDPPVLVNIRAVSNTAEGIECVARASRLINCVAIGCGGDAGIVTGNSYGATLVNYLSHGYSGDGFKVTNVAFFVTCLADGNSSDGYNLPDAEQSHFINCAATNNGAYGISGGADHEVFLHNCAMNPTGEANTSGKSVTVNIRLDDAEQTADPLFTDVSTDDFSVGSSSPWKAAGNGLGDAAYTDTVSFMDIGVAQREESG